MSSWTTWATSVADQLKSSSSFRQSQASNAQASELSSRSEIKFEYLALISELRNSASEVSTLESKFGAVVSGPEVERLASAIDYILFYGLPQEENKQPGNFWKLILAAAENAIQPQMSQITTASVGAMPFEVQKRESIIRSSVRKVLPPKLKRVFTKSGLCRAWVRAILTNHDSNNIALDLSNMIRALSMEKDALVDCYASSSMPSPSASQVSPNNKMSQSPPRMNRASASETMIKPNTTKVDNPSMNTSNFQVMNSKSISSDSTVSLLRRASSNDNTFTRTSTISVIESNSMLADSTVIEVIIGALAVLHPLTSKKQKLYLCLDDHNLNEAPVWLPRKESISAHFNVLVPAMVPIPSHKMLIGKCEDNSSALPEDESLLPPSETLSSASSIDTSLDSKIKPAVDSNMAIEVTGISNVATDYNSLFGRYIVNEESNNASKYQNENGFEIFLDLVATCEQPSMEQVRKKVKSSSLLKSSSFVIKKEENKEEVSSDEDEVNLDSSSCSGHLLNRQDTVELDTSRQFLGSYRWFLGSKESGIPYYSAPFHPQNIGDNQSCFVAMQPPVEGWVKNNTLSLELPKLIFKLVLRNDLDRTELTRDAVSTSLSPSIDISNVASFDGEWPSCAVDGADIKVETSNGLKISSIKTREAPQVVVFGNCLDENELFQAKCDDFDASIKQSKLFEDECLASIDDVGKEEVISAYEKISFELYNEAIQSRQESFDNLSRLSTIRQDKYMKQLTQYQHQFQSLCNIAEANRFTNQTDQSSVVNLEEVLSKCASYLTPEEVDQYQQEEQNLNRIIHLEGVTLEDALLDAKLIFNGTQAANEAAKTAAAMFELPKDKAVRKDKLAAMAASTSTEKIGCNENITASSSPVLSPSTPDRSNTFMLSSSRTNSGGGRDSDGSSSRSTTPVRSASNTKSDDQDNQEGAAAPPLSSTVLLKRLRDEGRRLVWLPPARVSSEIKSVEVLGVDDGLFVLRVSKVTIKTTPLVQPNTSNNQGISRSGSFNSDDEMLSSAASSRDNSEKRKHKNSFLLEHISRLEVCTMRVSLVQLEHMHSSVEQSLRELLKRENTIQEEPDSEECSDSDSDPYSHEDGGISDGSDYGSGVEEEKDKQVEASEQVVNIEPISNDLILPPLEGIVEASKKSSRTKIVKKQVSKVSDDPLFVERDLSSAASTNKDICVASKLTIPGFPSFPTQDPIESAKAKRKSSFLGMGGSSSSSQEKFLSALTTYMSELLAMQYSEAFFSLYRSQRELKSGSMMLASLENNSSKDDDTSHDLDMNSTNRARASSHAFDFDKDNFESIRESECQLVDSTLSRTKEVNPLSSQAQRKTRHHRGNKQQFNNISNDLQEEVSMKISEVISNHLWAMRYSYSGVGVSDDDGTSNKQTHESSGRPAILRATEKEVFDVSLNQSPIKGFNKSGMSSKSISSSQVKATREPEWGVSVDVESGGGGSGGNEFEDDYGVSAYLDISLIVDDEADLERRAEAAGEDTPSHSSNKSRKPSFARTDSGGISTGGGGGVSAGNSRAGLASRSEEEQLRRQNHRCLGCGVSLSSSLFIRNYAPCRFLDALFCKKYCHKDEHRVIPRRVLHHWDFVPHRVCCAAAAFLDDISRLPLLDVSLLSPGLLSAQSSLRNVRSLRHQLSYLRDLIYKAKFEKGIRLLKSELGGRIHLVLDTEIFSMKDLEQVNVGQMKPILDSLLDSLSEMAGSSIICRKWLTDAEKASNQSSSSKGVAGGGNLRLEERLLYRSLLGVNIT